MKRKSFVLLIALFVISLSTICFANNMGNDVKNAVNGATNTIVDGTQNLAEDVRSGIGNAENTVENGVRNMGDALMGGTTDFMGTQDNGYTATRTGAEDISVINNTAATTWTWIAVAIAALVIVGLVWYYSAEHHAERH